MLSEAERLVFASCKTPMQQRMVTVGEGIQINTWTSNGNDTKPALVCMHGWTASSAFWHLTIDDLAHHYKLYLADWVGFGRSSSVPFTGSSTQDAEDFWLRPFEEWRLAMGLDRFILAGHSLGGYLSCVYACAHPDRVVSLVLVSPGGVTANSTVLEPGTPVAEADAIESVAHHAAHEDDMEENREQSSRSSPPPPSPPQSIVFAGIKVTPGSRLHNWVWYFSPSGVLRALGPFGRQKAVRFLQRKWGHKANAAFTEYTYHMVARSGGHAGEDATRSIFRPIAVPNRPLSERVASLAMPSLWLYGDKDWMRVEAAVECKALIQPKLHACTHVVVVPNSSHQIMLDASGALADAMVNFINTAGKRVGKCVQPYPAPGL
jgi:cardiolipin-specific phospholipase